MLGELKPKGPKGQGSTGGLDVIRKEDGLSTEQFPVSAYVGSSKNLRDLKVLDTTRASTES